MTSMDFLVQLDEKLKDPHYRELTGIKNPLEVFDEYIETVDYDERIRETAVPQRRPKNNHDINW